MYIGDDAHLKCSQGHRFHMRNWRFQCDQHGFRDSSPEEFANALSLSMQQLGAGGTQWLQRLIGNMGTW